MKTVAESESDFRITTASPYLALSGELWGVYYEDLGDDWTRYNDTALYWTDYIMTQMHDRRHVLCE